jgi:hypothetical protein
MADAESALYTSLFRKCRVLSEATPAATVHHGRLDRVLVS